MDGLSYGDKTGEATAPDVKLSGVPANTAAWFTGGSLGFINSPGYWATGSESAGASTPGRPNSPENAAWIETLRPKPAISVSPAAHDFGLVLVGTMSAPAVVTVANQGCADLVLGSLSVSGSHPDQFRIQNDNCSGATIPPGGSRTVEVMFAPTSFGVKSAVLRIPSNDPAAPILKVTLLGDGQLVGDVNGDGVVDLVDLRVIYLAALGVYGLSAEERERADLNQDGIVDMTDVELLCGLVLGGCG